MLSLPRVDAHGRQLLFTADEVEQIVRDALQRHEVELTHIFEKTLQERLTGW